MARKLPPFASVRAFEAAARHCSFKQAGQELTLTPSAISHQVKSLENFFGLLLFYRHRSRLELTDAGKQYLHDLTKILDQLEIATDRVISSQETSALTINLFPSLASTWLVSRIPSLRKAHPEINVRMITSTEPLDFKSSEIDFSIHYLKKTEVKKSIKPGYMVDLLINETVIPVCSSAYIKAHGPLVEARDILGHALIYCDTESDEWPLWCDAVGVVYEEPPQRVVVDNRALAIKAAVDGLGIAMGRTPIHDDYISRGRLVTPLPFELVTGYAYYLVYTERKGQMRSVQKFRKWLLEASAGRRLEK
ncbi:MAG: LysR substrate-binding domain-containing protein [Rhodobacteraceae bacterium]|nr:LysR substrate-binding domain-containing protein [Paracoccaceae bacterium]